MYLYLLEDEKSDKLYVGVTENVQRRINEHNGENTHFTGRTGGVWKLVGVKELDKIKAYQEEKRLKKAKNKRYIRWYFLNSQVCDHSSTGRASPS